GRNPRNFAIDPSGRYLLAANQDSDNIVVFERDIKSGKLATTGTEVSVSMPVCLKLVPTA
ncbi:MAG: beta-propeller fold lactonase family protein, partial [Dehalococcoidia bacterium]|nr:beta-propeller fold lactonase family protein [Dehalococcoidia bacterium]